MVSARLMLRRVARALRLAAREDDFIPVLLGIGILVEILRRLGVAFVRVSAEPRERP